MFLLGIYFLPLEAKCNYCFLIEEGVTTLGYFLVIRIRLAHLVFFRGNKLKIKVETEKKQSAKEKEGRKIEKT